MEKVYVLTTQWWYDDGEEAGSDVSVYATLELAQKHMRKNYDELRADCPDWEFSIGDDNAYIYEDGHFARNRCEWLITETPIVTE